MTIEMLSIQDDRNKVWLDRIAIRSAKLGSRARYIRIPRGNPLRISGEMSVDRSDRLTIRAFGGGVPGGDPAPVPYPIRRATIVRSGPQLNARRARRYDFALPKNDWLFET